MEPLGRRPFLKTTAMLAGSSWLTPVGQWLARAAEGDALVRFLKKIRTSCNRVVVAGRAQPT